MSGTALAGSAIGALVGAVNFVVLWKLSERVELAKTRRVLWLVAWLDLVTLPVIGLVIGAYFWG